MVRPPLLTASTVGTRESGTPSVGSPSSTRIRSVNRTSPCRPSASARNPHGAALTSIEETSLRRHPFGVSSSPGGDSATKQGPISGVVGSALLGGGLGVGAQLASAAPSIAL